MSKLAPLSVLDKKIKARQRAAAVRSGYVDLGLRVAGIALAVLLLLSCMFMMTQAKGNGMYPAVKDGDLVIGFRLERKLAAGDVVVYEADGERRIGRIMARGGDIIEIGENGTVYVNGTLKEGEVFFPTYPKENEIVYPVMVPDDCCFILGDYRTQAADSRDFGVVPKKDVRCKVITVLRRRML